MVSSNFFCTLDESVSADYILQVTNTFQPFNGTKASVLFVEKKEHPGFQEGENYPVFMAVNQSIQRVIVAAADIAAGMKLGANLANQDAASGDTLATEPLDSAALSVAVATVAAAALAFLVCHISTN